MTIKSQLYFVSVHEADGEFVGYRTKDRDADQYVHTKNFKAATLFGTQVAAEEVARSYGGGGCGRKAKVWSCAGTAVLTPVCVFCGPDRYRGPRTVVCSPGEPAACWSCGDVKKHYTRCPKCKRVECDGDRTPGTPVEFVSEF